MSWIHGDCLTKRTESRRVRLCPIFFCGNPLLWFAWSLVVRWPWNHLPLGIVGLGMGNWVEKKKVITTSNHINNYPTMATSSARTVFGWRWWPTPVLKPLLPFMMSGSLAYFLFSFVHTKMMDGKY